MSMVKAEMSSSETDTSAGEERKSHALNNDRSVFGQQQQQQQHQQQQQRSVLRRKSRSNWSSNRLWRINHSNSSTQGSASDHETDHIDAASTGLDKPHPNLSQTEMNVIFKFEIFEIQ